MPSNIGKAIRAVAEKGNKCGLMIPDENSILDTTFGRNGRKWRVSAATGATYLKNRGVNNMLDIKFKYDEATTATIKNFETALYDYEVMLRDQLDKANKTCTATATFLFKTDKGRNKLLNQIARIKEMSIPVTIEITGGE